MEGLLFSPIEQTKLDVNVPYKSTLSLFPPSSPHSSVTLISLGVSPHSQACIQQYVQQ